MQASGTELCGDSTVHCLSLWVQEAAQPYAFNASHTAWALALRSSIAAATLQHAQHDLAQPRPAVAAGVLLPQVSTDAVQGA